MPHLKKINKGRNKNNYKLNNRKNMNNMKNINREIIMPIQYGYFNNNA
jgi:hypothetical protein